MIAEKAITPLDPSQSASRPQEASPNNARHAEARTSTREGVSCYASLLSDRATEIQSCGRKRYERPLLRMSLEWSHVTGCRSCPRLGHGALQRRQQAGGLRIRFGQR